MAVLLLQDHQTVLLVEQAVEQAEPEQQVQLMELQQQELEEEAVVQHQNVFQEQVLQVLAEVELE